MWLRILSALVVIMAWAAWFFFGLVFNIGIWVPIAVTVAVAGIIALRRIRAARAARALERAIAPQGQELWNPMVWPGPKSTGARIQVRGAGGLDEEMVREGPWGIFRLFEAGTTTAEEGKDDVFTVTWRMTAPLVTVTLEVRPTTANHPFPPSFFRATNCPPSIGDSLGKGTG